MLQNFSYAYSLNSCEHPSNNGNDQSVSFWHQVLEKVLSSASSTSGFLILASCFRLSTSSVDSLSASHSSFNPARFTHGSKATVLGYATVHCTSTVRTQVRSTSPLWYRATERWMGVTYLYVYVRTLHVFMVYWLAISINKSSYPCVVYSIS